MKLKPNFSTLATTLLLLGAIFSSAYAQNEAPKERDLLDYYSHSPRYEKVWKKLQGGDSSKDPSKEIELAKNMVYFDMGLKLTVNEIIAYKAASILALRPAAFKEAKKQLRELRAEKRLLVKKHNSLLARRALSAITMGRTGRIGLEDQIKEKHLKIKALTEKIVQSKQLSRKLYLASRKAMNNPNLPSSQKSIAKYHSRTRKLFGIFQVYILTEMVLHNKVVWNGNGIVGPGFNSTIPALQHVFDEITD
jgi:hypothetical protein